MEGLFYNADDGYLEAIVRGYRSSILTNTAYINLTQCETLEGKIEHQKAHTNIFQRNQTHSCQLMVHD